MQIFDYETAIKNMGDDEDIYEAVLETFLEDTPVLIDSVEKAINEGDREAIKRHSHSLKSSSRTIGGMLLGDVAEKCEQESLEDKLDTVRILLEKIRKEYDKLLCEIRNRGLI